MIILFFLIPLIMLIIITWLSYFLTDRITAALQKDAARPEKGLRYVCFIAIFVILFLIAWWFYINNFTLHR